MFGSIKPERTIRTAVDAAHKRLNDDFELAIKDYTRAGNLDGALAVRDERDAFLKEVAVDTRQDHDPKVQIDGKWSIVFSSSDPFLFGVPVLNNKSFSVGFDKMPQNVHYVRIRRMDTGEFVNLDKGAGAVNQPMTRGSFIWRGDKRINRQACDLGIIDIRNKLTDRSLAPLMVMMPEGDFTGWGFGEWWSGQERQGYVWNGKKIDDVVFEISLGDGPLTEDELGQLLNP